MSAQGKKTRTEDGFVTIQVLGIVVMMLGTMLMLVGAAASSRHAAREGREFTQASRATDQGLARVLHYFNSTLPSSAPFGSGGATSRGTATMPAYGDPVVFPETLWSTNATTRTVKISTASDDSTKVVEMPVRGKLVSSYKKTGDGVAVGIPAGPKLVSGQVQDALGAWGAAVSSAYDSGVTGTVVGQWDMFGGVVSNAAGATVVSYSNTVAQPATLGTGGTFNRSQLNAYLDQRQLDKMLAQVATNTASCPGSALASTSNLNTSSATYQCAKGDVTLSAINRSIAGVTTVVVKGNLVIDANINTGTVGELHLYVDGNVTFAQPSGIQTLNRVFIFAPDGVCRSTAGAPVSVLLTGSIACRTVWLNSSIGGNNVTWAEPRNQPATAPYTGNVETPAPVYYFEKTGFTDRLTP